METTLRGRAVTFGFLTLVCLAIDLGSKSIVFDSLGGPYQSTGWLIDGWLKFEIFTSLNHGALWGFGQGFSLWFAAISVLAILGILYWLFVRRACSSLLLTCSLGMISGGTLGNLYDRLGLHGVREPGFEHSAMAVRDFFHFVLGPLDWAIFNAADCFLVVGSAMLFLHSLMEERQQSRARAAEQSELQR